MSMGEEKRSSAAGWSELPPELLAVIFRRLDAVDYTLCLSVCASWRSVPERTMGFCKPRKDVQLPWLLVSSPGNDPTHRRFHLPCRFHTKMARRTVHLPQIARRGCTGSSQGFLITFDGSARFSAVNPVTGAFFPLPPTATHPDIHLYDDSHSAAPPLLITPDNYYLKVGYRKAVISPSLDAIAVAAGDMAEFREKPYRFISSLAFARPGDDSWTALVPPRAWRDRNPVVADFTFHKGRIYALYLNGYLVVFDLHDPAAPPLVSPRMRKRMRGHGHLTETPDGEDLLLLTSWSTGLAVFRLDKSKLRWNRVRSIGDVALFFDRDYLSSLSTRELPCLESNCVYLADITMVMDAEDWASKVNYAGVYDLENGSVHPLCHDDERVGFFPQPLWFTPTL